MEQFIHGLLNLALNYYCSAKLGLSFQVLVSYLVAPEMNFSNYLCWNPYSQTAIFSKEELVAKCFDVGSGNH